MESDWLSHVGDKSVVVEQTQTTVYKHELCSHSSCRKGGGSPLRGHGYRFTQNLHLGNWSLLICFPGGTRGKETACQYRKQKRHGFDPCVGKILWRRAWQPTPGLLPGKSYGQRSLAGYHTHDCKESDKPIGSDSKESVCNARDWVQPLGRRI